MSTPEEHSMNLLADNGRLLDELVAMKAEVEQLQQVAIAAARLLTSKAEAQWSLEHADLLRTLLRAQYDAAPWPPIAPDPGNAQLDGSADIGGEGDGS